MPIVNHSLPLTLEQIDECLSLLYRYPNMFESQEINRYEQLLAQKSKNQFLFAHLVKNQIKGWLLVGEPYDSDKIWNIVCLAIDPMLKRQGIGSQLMKAVEEEASQAKVSGIFLETSGGNYDEGKVARSFYSKCGFNSIGTIPNYWGFEDDKVIFYKKITSP